MSTHKRITVLLMFIGLVSPVIHAYSASGVAVTVEGVDGEIKKNVLAYLSIERHREHPDLTVNRIIRYHKSAPDEIRQALQPFGYYAPVIHNDLTREGGVWHALYRIDPGEPVVVEKVDILITGEGAGETRLNSLRRKFPVREGEILNHQRYEQAKRKLNDTAVRIGFLDAHMKESSVSVYPDRNAAAIVLRLDTGPQYRFGDVRFVQDVFRNEFLERFVAFQRGDLYMLQDILSLQNALNDSDNFVSVEVTPRMEEAEGREVPVEVTLHPRRRHKYTFGIGYGTDTGVRGSLGWENRRVNPIGHKFKAGLKLSEIRSAFSADYSIPLRDPRIDSLVFTAGWLTEETKTSSSEKYFGNIQYNHVRATWKESMYLSYEQEAFDIGDDTGRATLFMPGMSWARISHDSAVNARRGSRLFFDVRGAHEFLLSDASFVQLRTRVKFIRGVSSRGRLILRGEGGMTLVDKFSELPASVRFFAGGDQSVRGYSYNSLGPEDASGDITGGRHLLVTSIEYEHRIRGKWSAAVFYDMGNAIDSLSDPFRQAAGFGVRWRSPAGPVRFDLAFPLSDTEKAWRIHFSIGPDI